MGRGSRLVPRRHHLYRRDLQGGGEAHFAKGASLPDPNGLFNASLDGGTRRAIDIRQGERLDEAAFAALVVEAAKLNAAKRAKP